MIERRNPRLPLTVLGRTVADPSDPAFVGLNDIRRILRWFNLAANEGQVGEEDNALADRLLAIIGGREDE